MSHVYLPNSLPEYGRQLEGADAASLGLDAVARVASVLKLRENSAATPLRTLAGLAAQLGLGALYVKDEGLRLGLGS